MTTDTPKKIARRKNDFKNREKIRARTKLWKLKNAEKIRAQKKLWRLNNKEKTREQNKNYRAKNYARLQEYNKSFWKEWYKTNKQKVRANSKRWLLKNPERHIKNQRRYYQEHKETLKERARFYCQNTPREHQNRRAKLWRQKNPGKAKALALRRTILLRKASQGDGTGITAFMEIIRASEFIKCYYCHKPTPSKGCHIDHIKPLFRGGLHTIDNLCATCPRCNYRKNSKLISEWKIEGQQILPV